MSAPLGGGVSVEVVSADGTVLATQRTFSDGVFYIQRLPPGRYEVRVAASSALALPGPPPQPVSFELEAGSGALLELPPLIVVPAG